MTPTPCQLRLQATAEAAGLPCDLLLSTDPAAATRPNAPLLLLLSDAGVYPALYDLPRPLPRDALAETALVTCEECVSTRRLDTTHRVWISPAWAAEGRCSAVVRCPQCACLLYVPLLPPAAPSALPWWRWRWWSEARAAHLTYRGLGATPLEEWRREWGYPIPLREPHDPPPLSSRVMEPAMPMRLSQPVSYYLHSLGDPLLGYLTSAPPQGERHEVSVDLPTRPEERRAALREMLSLVGSDPDRAEAMMDFISIRVWAIQGRASGQWWPRAMDVLEEPAPILAEEE